MKEQVCVCVCVVMVALHVRGALAGPTRALPTPRLHGACACAFMSEWLNERVSVGVKEKTS